MCFIQKDCTIFFAFVHCQRSYLYSMCAVITTGRISRANAIAMSPETSMAKLKSKQAVVEARQ